MTDIDTAVRCDCGAILGHGGILFANHHTCQVTQKKARDIEMHVDIAGPLLDALRQEVADLRIEVNALKSRLGGDL